MRFTLPLIALVASALASPLEDAAAKNNDAQQIVDAARSKIGTPYVLGGGNCDGKTKGGFDCSGLVLYSVCKATGKKLIHNSQAQYDDDKKQGQRIPYKEAKKGDVFFYGINGECKVGGSSIHHTNIKSDKAGKVINAGNPVKEESFFDDFHSSDGHMKICKYAIRYW